MIASLTRHARWLLFTGIIYLAGCVDKPGPEISEVTPNVLSTEQGGEVHILGTFFDPKASVMLSGISVETQWVSDSELHITAPPAIGQQGFASIVVTNPDGQSVATKTLFSYYSTQLLFDDEQAKTIALASADPRAMDIADLDGDGTMDIVYSSRSLFRSSASFIGILFGNGTKKSLPISFRGETDSLLLADLNHDHILDILVADQGMNDVIFIPGAESGIFGKEKRSSLSPKDQFLGIRSIRLVDMNHDGNMDLVSANEIGNSISVALGNGDGTFSSDVDTFLVDSNPTLVRSADLDGDNHPDLVTNPIGLGNVDVLLHQNDFKKDFRSYKKAPIGNESSVSPKRIELSDVNHDGKPDLIVAIAGTNDIERYTQLTISLGIGDGSFGPPLFLPLPPSNGIQMGLDIYDMNGDLHPDIVLLQKHAVQILLGNGDGSFASTLRFNEDLSSSDDRSLKIMDMNKDGKPDLVIANSRNALPPFVSGNIQIFYNTSK